jgi:secreted Zn-dependent insulinase-like peptidase
VKDLSLYETREAGFNPRVSFEENWTISVYGYSDPEKVEDVLNRILDVLLSLEFNMDQALFNSTVVRLTQDYYDEEHSDSYYYAKKYVQSVKNKDFVDGSDVKNVAGEILQSEVKEYMINFLKDVSVSCSVFGNAKKEHAIRYSSIVKDKILKQGSLIQNVDRRAMMDQDVYKIPAGPSHVVRRRMKNIEQVTSATFVVFQLDREESNGGIDGSPSYTVFAFTELLGLIMGQSCFIYLRTEVITLISSQFLLYTVQDI